MSSFTLDYDNLPWQTQTQEKILHQNHKITIYLPDSIPTPDNPDGIKAAIRTTISFTVICFWSCPIMAYLFLQLNVFKQIDSQIRHYLDSSCL